MFSRSSESSGERSKALVTEVCICSLENDGKWSRARGKEYVGKVSLSSKCAAQLSINRMQLKG